MTEQPENPISKSLRQIETKLDLAVKDFNTLKQHVAGIGTPGTQVALLLAGTNSRLDLVDERLARIADRLAVIQRDLAAGADGSFEICK